jgi:poly(A) polymerase
MHRALGIIQEVTRGTEWENDVYLVGGAVRDQLLGNPPKDDFDLVTLGSAPDLALHLFDQGVTAHYPVTFPRFGTAMVTIADTPVELVTARKESYDEETRKPSVEPATYEEDALRRDFTVNTLRKSLFGGEIIDTLGNGLSDLRAKILRTPLDPIRTFYDDPLRMFRAVRFTHRLGFQPADGLYEAIRESVPRLAIVSMERIRDEFLKILVHPTGADALEDLRVLGLLEWVMPELLAMKGVEQGKYHHLDVWDHTRLVVRNIEKSDPILKLSALLHDVGKPSTRTVDQAGNTRFFGHESVGAEMTMGMLRRLMLSEKEVTAVASLVKNHMRLGSSPTFTPTAARRLIRDMGDQLEGLLTLVEADAGALRPGVRVMDLAEIRNRLEEILTQTPRQELESPLSGREIMELLAILPGRQVGEAKHLLTEMVLEGQLAANDREAAKAVLLERER